MAADHDPDAFGSTAAQEQVSHVGDVSDIQPTDWAYQALRNLIERYGCVSGDPGGLFTGARAISRYEAAALLDACLERISTVTDEVKALVAAFANERATLQGRANALTARVGMLDAQQFSTTTTFSVEANMVVGANQFSGSANDLITTSRNNYGATTFNYDIRISLNTSFNGQDLLHTRLRAGNFDIASNSFYGAGPSRLSQLEVAFEQLEGDSIVAIDRLYYKFPLGQFTFILGAIVEQDDMLAMYPSVYPNSTVLDMFTMAGTPVSYDFNLGPGAGLWWKQDAWSLSLSYIAQDGFIGNPGLGGIGTQSSRASTTVQLGYQKDQWGLALIYTAIQGEVYPYSTNFLQTSLSRPGLFQTVGLSGYWQPQNSGWLPSISAGAEITQFDYSPTATRPNDSVAANSVAWSVGLQWLDVLSAGNAAGLALGQAPHAINLLNGGGVNDTNWMWEWWFKLQISDSISVTPALFYLWRPLGQDTPAGQSFNQVGALIKTQFRF